MSHMPPIEAPLPDDTRADSPGLDEVPPYGEPGDGMRRMLLVALVVVGLVVTAWIAARFWRRVARLIARLVAGGVATAATVSPRTTYDKEVIVIPEDVTASGPVYRIKFYDGTYEQLTKRDLNVVVDLNDPQLAAKLEFTAQHLAEAVERLDGQRCFEPRLVLLDGLGRQVAEWTSTGVRR